jgi:hypothetical protein
MCVGLTSLDFWYGYGEGFMHVRINFQDESFAH